LDCRRRVAGNAAPEVLSQFILTEAHAMSNESKKDQVRIELTPDQQKQVFEKIGQQAEAIELSSTELEERIAPRRPLNI